MRLERVSIPAEGVVLSALTYTPRTDKRDLCVILSHGFTASKESVDLMAGYLCSRGYCCLTFDFRGHKLGGSSGDLNHASDILLDLEAAAHFALERFEKIRCILVGHSMGGLASVLTAESMPKVAAVVVIATGPRPSAGFRQPVGIAMLSQRSDYVSGAEPMALLEQLDELTAGFNGLGARPSLFVAAKGDAVVKPSRVRELADMAGPQAEYAEIEGSHLGALDRARGLVANWLDRQFG